MNDGLREITFAHATSSRRRRSADRHRSGGINLHARSYAGSPWQIGSDSHKASPGDDDQAVVADIGSNSLTHQYVRGMP